MRAPFLLAFYQRRKPPIQLIKILNGELISPKSLSKKSTICSKKDVSATSVTVSAASAEDVTQKTTQNIIMAITTANVFFIFLNLSFLYIDVFYQYQIQPKRRILMIHCHGVYFTVTSQVSVTVLPYLSVTVHVTVADPLP